MRTLKRIRTISSETHVVSTNQFGDIIKHVILT